MNNHISTYIAIVIERNIWKSFDEIIQCTETLIQAELYVYKCLYNFQKTPAFCGADSVITRFWAHFMAIFAFFRKSDKIGNIVLKFAKMDPSQKRF